MDKKTAKRLESRAALLKSLAHPARLLILEILEGGPRCVGDLTGAVGSDITTVSKHLALLRGAGLVRSAKRGTFSDYELACGCLGDLLAKLEDCAREEACGKRAE